MALDYRSSNGLELIDRYLGLPVVDAESEVWVGIEDAFFEDDVVEVGPVEFWNGPRLRDALVKGSAGAVQLPDAVRRHGWLFEWMWERYACRAGFALAKVQVGTGRPGDARGDARNTVAALLVLAEFDNGYSSWRVAEQGLLHFTAGEWVYRQQLDCGREPKGPELARVVQDDTPNALRARASSVAPSLPLRRL